MKFIRLAFAGSVVAAGAAGAILASTASAAGPEGCFVGSGTPNVYSGVGGGSCTITLTHSSGYGGYGSFTIKTTAGTVVASNSSGFKQGSVAAGTYIASV